MAAATGGGAAAGTAPAKPKEISFNPVRDYYRAYLTKIIGVFSPSMGSVALVLDPGLSPALSSVIGMKFLKESGVKDITILEPNTAFKTSCDVVLYIIRPSVPAVKSICYQIKQHREVDNRLNIVYAIFFVPKPSTVCLKELESQGLYGEVRVSTFPMDLIPTDPDMASLQMETSFRDCYLHPDRAVLHAVAESIFNLQFLYGLIPTVTGIGRCSEVVSQLLTAMTNKVQPATAQSFASRHIASKKNSHIRRVILIDRDVDMITPLMTQLTYEGLIDEVFGIESSFVTLPPGLADAAPAATAGGDQTPNAAAAAAGDSKSAPASAADAKSAALAAAVAATGNANVAAATTSALLLTPSSAASGASSPSAGGAGPASPASPPPAKVTKYKLNADDILFNVLRDRSFAAVLHQIKHSVSDYKGKLLPSGKGAAASIDISTLSAFVKGVLPDLIKQKTALSTHITLCRSVTAITDADSDFSRILRVESDLLEHYSQASTVLAPLTAASSGGGGGAATGDDERKHYFELLCIRHTNLSRVLRLLCLFSLVSGGLKPKEFDYYRDCIAKNYGYDQLLTLHNLERLNLFVSTQSNAGAARDFNWRLLSRAFQLIVPSIDPEQPTDIHYCFSAACYGPLSVRLIESYLTSGCNWSAADKHLKKSAAKESSAMQSFTYTYPGVSTAAAASTAAPAATAASGVTAMFKSVVAAVSSSGGSAASKDEKAEPGAAEDAVPGSTLIFFVGGMTYAEASALRWLSSQKRLGAVSGANGTGRLLFATTQFLTGSTLIHSLIERVDKSTIKL